MVPFLLAACAGAAVGELPTPLTAKSLHAALRAGMPEDPEAHLSALLAGGEGGAGAKVLIVGDSWGTVVGVGSSAKKSFFTRKLNEHQCRVTATSIAVPGTETGDWTTGAYLAALKAGARVHDYVWVVLGGNDALDEMPDCASSGKTAPECGDELYAKAVPNLGKIADAVHEANPNAKVVGFGYDTMFGGLGCRLVTSDIFPQCYKRGGGGNRCFNTQFLRIQHAFEDMAANRSWAEATSILGATQVAGGDTKASTDPSKSGADRIDMDKMGPAKYWPDYEGCFHPGVFGGDDSGAMVVMEQFYKSYWAQQPACQNQTAVLV